MVGLILMVLASTKLEVHVEAQQEVCLGSSSNKINIIET
jgi:hypothetical protein